MTEVTKQLTEQINEEYRAFDRDFKSAALHAIRCGELLEEKKTSLKHGEWLPWLREHFEGSERHANRFMKLAREQAELDPTRVSDLSIRGAMRELSSSKNSLANEVANTYDWRDGEREEFDALSEKEQLLELRGSLVDKYMFLGPEDKYQPNYNKKVRGQLDQINKVIRPIDLPEGRERRFCEEFLTYRQMHQTIAELITAGFIRQMASQEVFENFIAAYEAA